MKKKIIVSSVIIISIFGIFSYYLGFYEKRIDIYTQPADQKLSAKELFSRFEQDENKANAIFIDKIIEVSGTIAEIQKNQENKVLLILRETDEMFGVICTMREKEIVMNTIKIGDSIWIKGICKGFLSDVIINDCIIIKEQ